MIRQLQLEGKLGVPWGVGAVALVFAILRATRVLSPQDEHVWAAWLAFLEGGFPLTFPLLTFALLEREKAWRTLEVLAATPYRKALLLAERYLIVLVLLSLTMVAAVRPQEYLLLIAPGLALGGLTLMGGLMLGEDVGLALGLGWWGASFVVGVARAELLERGILSWILLGLSENLPPAAIAVRKWAHFGMGLGFFLIALVVAEYKRSWQVR